MRRVLNGKLVPELYVDTMSDFTLISPELLKEIEGKVALQSTTKNLPTVMAANSARLTLHALVQIPAVKRGAITCLHPFLVSSDLPQSMKCLLGNDILSKIGISMNGLDSDFSEASGESVTASVIEPALLAEGQDLGRDLADAISSIARSTKKDLNYLDRWYTYRQRLSEEIAPLIEQNQKINGFCSHPAAEIFFRTIDDIPINVRQYDLPYQHRSVVDAQVATWLKDGIIERCNSNDHSNNPLLVVPKRDIAGRIKAWRTCIDPRLINNKIIDSAYPLPKARDIFDKLAGGVVFTVIDLKAGFNQICVHAMHRKKTAFSWNKRVYQFVGAPFGFKNIPQISNE